MGINFLVLLLISCTFASKHQHHVLEGRTSDHFSFLARDDLHENTIPDNATHKDVVDREGGSTVSNTFPNLGLVYNKASGSRMGITFAVNSRWSISSSKIYPQGTPRGDVRVYTSTNYYDQASLNNARRHRIKETRYHPNIDGNKNSLVLIKVCPSFLSWGDLPSAPMTYAPGLYGGVTNYATDLNYYNKDVAHNCECDENPGWDADYQFCLEESASLYNADNEKGALFYPDGNVYAGISCYDSSTSGESYLNLSKYLDWISNNTPV